MAIRTDELTPAETALLAAGYSRAATDLQPKESNEGPRPVYERMSGEGRNHQKAIVGFKFVNLYRLESHPPVSGREVSTVTMEDLLSVKTDDLDALKKEFKRRVKYRA